MCTGCARRTNDGLRKDQVTDEGSQRILAARATPRAFLIVIGVVALSVGLFLGSIRSQEAQADPQISGNLPPSSPTPKPGLPPIKVGTESLQQQILHLNGEVNTLRPQVAALQASNARLTSGATTLQNRLSAFQTAYNHHTHLYENVCPAIGFDTIPLMYCSQTNVPSACSSQGMITVLTFTGQYARQVITSVPTPIYSP